MPDDRVAFRAVRPRPAVSPNNPCPFLRALVATDVVDGHIVPLSELSRTVGAASGEKGLKETSVGVKAYLVALIANGLGPLACCGAVGRERSSTRCAMVLWTSMAAVRAFSA